LRQLLARLTKTTLGLECVCICKSAEDALRLIPDARPDVVIMDIQLPGMSGIECTARLRQTAPASHVLILTVFGDSDQIFEALKAGASGYLLKRAAPSEIVEAIRDVQSGGAPMTPEIARRVVVSFRPASPASAKLEHFTPREEEILQLLAKGYVTKETADQLHISFDTVRRHLRHIYEKLHVRSRTEAVIKYLQ
jgi:DNA-binding NarL/FixJ family response regulator